MNTALVKLMGGEKPVREFTFKRYRVTEGNNMAFVRAQQFDPRRGNLYLWGACGVGKTHLAYAIGRRSIETDRSVVLLKPPELMRKVRMKDPDEEQQTLDRLVRIDVLILDDLGMGTDTLYSRQILQEIFDCRSFRGQGGLVVTSKFSLDQLAVKFGDDTIPSRLAGMCSIVHIRGADGRLRFREKD